MRSTSKSRSAKLSSDSCPTYEPQYLLAPYSSKYYLNKLDLSTSRYLAEHLNLTGAKLKFAAYLLVTYAIEVRADLIYPIYQQILTDSGSKVSVRSIILEEQGHLEEMIGQLKKFSADWEFHANKMISIEQKLYKDWIKDLAAAIHEERQLY